MVITKNKFFVMFLLLLFSFFSVSIEVHATEEIAIPSKSSTYVLRNDNLEITDIQYTITENNEYKITVTANCVYSQYLHYCNLLYTYEVSDSTITHLDWSDSGVDYVEPVSVDGTTFVYELIITQDCVIAVNLMEGSSGYVSKPFLVYLSDFPTEPVTEPTTNPLNSTLFFDENSVNAIIYSVGFIAGLLIAKAFRFWW